MGSRNPGKAKYTGGMQSPQSFVLCSDIVESEQTRVDPRIGPGSLVMKGSGVRVSPSAFEKSLQMEGSGFESLRRFLASAGSRGAQIRDPLRSRRVPKG